MTHHRCMMENFVLLCKVFIEYEDRGNITASKNVFARISESGEVSMIDQKGIGKGGSI